MGYERQVNLLAACLAAFLVFVGAVFLFMTSLRTALLLATATLLASVLYGRSILRFVTEFFE